MGRSDRRGPRSRTSPYVQVPMFHVSDVESARTREILAKNIFPHGIATAMIQQGLNHTGLVTRSESSQIYWALVEPAVNETYLLLHG